MAIYLAHVGCSLTYTEAGALYGRNRTTAAHACRVVEQRRDDGQFDRILELLEACMRLSVVQAHPVMAAHVSNYGNQGIDRRQPHRGNDV